MNNDLSTFYCILFWMFPFLKRLSVTECIRRGVFVFRDKFPFTKMEVSEEKSKGLRWRTRAQGFQNTIPKRFQDLRCVSETTGVDDSDQNVVSFTLHSILSSWSHVCFRPRKIMTSVFLVARLGKDKLSCSFSFVLIQDHVIWFWL
jgi:hypothetical protein